MSKMETCVGTNKVRGIFRVKYKKPVYLKTPKEYLRDKIVLRDFFKSFNAEISEHYDNLQQANENHLRQQKQPLKDATNTNAVVKQEKINNNNNNNNEDQQQRNNTARREPESTQHSSSNSDNNHQGSRSLQCLETLAQKAGIHDITADDCKYDIAHTLLNLDRGQQQQQQIIKQQESVNHSSMSDIKSQQQ
ncbi:hypothetical protein HHI36_005128, partial [Cryptolaemus montrouzieri]